MVLDNKQIWVDADACPVVIKETLFRAAERTQTVLTLVANHYLKTPPSRVIRLLQVEKGYDIADNEIVKRCKEGDLVITSDLPLANDVLEKGAIALTPRGDKLTLGTIKSRLNMRDFLETMRASGERTGGPPPLSQQDRQQFANELDAILAKWP